MATVTINNISESDLNNLYSRSKVSKFVPDDTNITPPSSPPIKHSIQLSSGRRNGSSTKQSPVTNRETEKLSNNQATSNHRNNNENGEVKELLRTFTPIKIDNEQSNIINNNNNRTLLKTSNDTLIPIIVSHTEEVKIQLESPPLQIVTEKKEATEKQEEVKKDESPKRIIMEEDDFTPIIIKKADDLSSGRRELKVNAIGEKQVKSNPRPLTEIMEEDKMRKERREKERIEKQIREQSIREKEEERNIPESPPAERRHENSRSPVNSGVKSSKSPRKHQDQKRRGRDGREAEERISNRRSVNDKRSVNDRNEPDRSDVFDHRSTKRNDKSTTNDRTKSRTKSRSGVQATSPTEKIRPKSPHRHKKDIGIRIGGEALSSGEYTRLDDSSSSSLNQRPKQPSKPKRDEEYSDRDTKTNKKYSGNTDSGDESGEDDESKSEVSSRTKIRSRKEAFEKKLSEKYKDEEFYPEDDDHLRDAIKIALDESKKKSVQEAQDAGMELSSRVLSSLTRPNAVGEVIEKLVSQRRERIRSSKRRSPLRKHKTTTTKSKKKEKKEKENVRVQKKNTREVISDDEPEVKTMDESALDEPVKEQEIKKVEVKKVEVKKVEAEKPEINKVEPVKPPLEKKVDIKLSDVVETIETNIQRPKVTMTMDSILPGTTILASTPTPPLSTTAPILANMEPILVDPVREPPNHKVYVEDDRKVKKKVVKKSDKRAVKKSDKRGKSDKGKSELSESDEEVITVTKRTKNPKKKQQPIEENEEEDEDKEEGNGEDEKDVKLPYARRKRKPGEEFDAPFKMDGDDYAYDPLGIGEELDPGNEINVNTALNPYYESEEDEEKLTIDEKKDEMMYRFRCVKEGYPNIALPRITKQMKLAKMVRLYEHVMSKIKLKVKTRNFKVFLIGGFIAMQFIGKKFGLDMAGFTVNQMHSINVYNRLLREMGESDWTGIGVDLPVLVRLPFFMCVNAAIFVIAKFVFKKTGHDYSKEFYNIYSSLIGGDDFTYADADGAKGLDAGDGEKGGGGEEGGGIFGMIKSLMSMFGGSSDEGDKPKRGEAGGPSVRLKRKKPKPTN